MITITNDKETKIVTKGAYENFYKPLGFEIVKEKIKEVKKVENTDKKLNEIKEDNNKTETKTTKNVKSSQKKSSKK